MSSDRQLTVPVSLDDHSRGPESAPITLVEYSDFQCPYCAQANRLRPAVLATGTVRWVFRHFPVSAIHPRAMAAAMAAEAAGRQGRFWEMHHRLFTHQGRLGDNDLVEHAAALGLDLDAFRQAIVDPAVHRRILADRDKGLDSGITGTPGFFVNERRQDGPWVPLLKRLAQARTPAP
jgi:protein-disulfide isomerase